jgi:hypothetical protein
MPRAEVARQVGITEDELARWLAHADEFLKARLREFGLGPSRDSGGRMLVPCAAAPEEGLGGEFDRICRDARAGQPT